MQASAQLETLRAAPMAAAERVGSLRVSRRAWGVAAALLSLALLAGALELSAGRPAQRAYAGAARLANNLRLFYQVHTGLEEVKAGAATGQKSPARQAKPLRCSASASLP